MKKYIIGAMLLASIISTPQVGARTENPDVAQKIKQLEMLIIKLQAEITALQNTPEKWCHTFTVNLRIQDSGDEVAALKTALEKEGLPVTETNIFDTTTASSVSTFQETHQRLVLAPHSIANGTGYVDAATRAQLNSLYGCEKSVFSHILPNATKKSAPVKHKNTEEKKETTRIAQNTEKKDVVVFRTPEKEATTKENTFRMEKTTKETSEKGTVTITAPQSSTTITEGEVLHIAWDAGPSDAYEKVQIVIGNTEAKREYQLYEGHTKKGRLPNIDKAYNAVDWRVPNLSIDFVKGGSKSFEEIKDSFYITVKLLRSDRVSDYYIGVEDTINLQAERRNNYSAPGKDLPFLGENAKIIITDPILMTSDGFKRSLTRGNELTISWKSQDIPEGTLLNIAFIGDGGIYALAENVKNTGRTTLYSGTDLNGNSIPNGTYKIRVCTQNVTGDLSDVVCGEEGPFKYTNKG